MVSEKTQAAQEVAQDISAEAATGRMYEVGASAIHGVGKAVDFAVHHPVATGGLLGTIVLGAALLRHSKKRHDENQFVARMGTQPIPTGSMAGMNSDKSAFIQMDGTGYDSPAQQGAMNGTTM